MAGCCWQEGCRPPASPGRDGSLTAEPAAAAQLGWTVTQLRTRLGLIWGGEVTGEPCSLNRDLSPLVTEFCGRFPVALAALLLAMRSLCFRLMTWVIFRECKARGLKYVFNL